jgi:hypothetical protein
MEEKMGGASSTARTNVATKTVVEALTENIMNCHANSIVTQRFVVTGSFNVISGVKQVQHMVLSSSCWQSAENIAELQQSVSNALKQAARSQSVSVLGVLGKSDSEVDAFISNEVTQKITQRTVQNIVNSSNMMQEIVIEGDQNIVDNVSQEQTAKIVFDNAQEALNGLTSVQAIENAAEQESAATQTNFVAEIVDSVLGGLGGLMLTWIIVAAVALVGGFVLGPKKLIGVFVGECEDESGGEDESGSEDENEGAKKSETADEVERVRRNTREHEDQERIQQEIYAKAEKELAKREKQKEINERAERELAAIDRLKPTGPEYRKSNQTPADKMAEDFYNG